MNTVHLTKFPKPYFAYPKIIRSFLAKKLGETQLPQTEYIVDQFNLDIDHLEKYQKVCGLQHYGHVPALYFAMLSQSLQMQMMGEADFPFPILGLVHLRNQIKQHRLVLRHEILTLSCRYGELWQHAKGLAFDFVVTVKVEDEVVVESLMTYLFRQNKEKSNEEAIDIADYVLNDQWRVAENTGRRYGLISGDLNFIHLHKLGAKPFGFRRAISHGMWSKAKVLSHFHLPNAYEVDVWFKAPMYLPSKVELLTKVQGECTNFIVRDVKTKKVNLIGHLKAL